MIYAKINYADYYSKKPSFCCGILFNGLDKSNEEKMKKEFKNKLSYYRIKKYFRHRKSKYTKEVKFYVFNEKKYKEFKETDSDGYIAHRESREIPKELLLEFLASQGFTPVSKDFFYLDKVEVGFVI